MYLTFWCRQVNKMLFSSRLFVPRRSPEKIGVQRRLESREDCSEKDYCESNLFLLVVLRVSQGKVGRVSQKQLMMTRCTFPHLTVPWRSIILTCPISCVSLPYLRWASF